MNINITRHTALLLAVLAVFLMAPIRCFASGASVSVMTGSEISAGKEFTVTVEFTADSDIGRVSAVLSYSHDDIEFVGSGFATGGDGFLNISGTPDGSSDKLDIPVVFRAKNGGSSNINVTNGSIMSPEGKMLGELLTAGLEITASGEPRPQPPEPPAVESSLDDTALPTDDSGVSDSTDRSFPDESSFSDSSDSSSEDFSETDPLSEDSSSIPDDGGLARLKSLTVSAGKLKPDFSQDIFDYEVTVPPETEYISVDAELKDRYDTIWYEGSEYLGIGMTPWTITVTTPDGTVSHAYNIRITRHTEDYSEPDEEESSVTEAVTETTSSEALEKLAKSSESLPSISQEPTPLPEKPSFRERIMPILIIAVCVIITAVGLIVLRIQSKSKKDYTK